MTVCHHGIVVVHGDRIVLSDWIEGNGSMTYEIVYNNGGSWSVVDAIGVHHGGVFESHYDAEVYAEGRISVFEGIEAKGME